MSSPSSGPGEQPRGAKRVALRYRFQSALCARYGRSDAYEASSVRKTSHLTVVPCVLERLFRDARLYPIGGGTREIMNELISKAEGYR